MTSREASIRRTARMAPRAAKTKGKPSRPCVVLHSDIKQFIPDFLKSQETNAAGVLDCLGRGDFYEVRRWGHKLKGVGSTYGFHRISELGGRILLAAERKDARDIRQACDELMGYLSAVEVRYED